MLKSKLLSIVLFSAVGQRAYQNAAPVSSKGLILAIGSSKQDTNRVSALLKLGSYYLFKTNGYKSNRDSAIYFLNQAAQLSI